MISIQVLFHEYILLIFSKGKKLYDYKNKSERKQKAEQ